MWLDSISDIPAVAERIGTTIFELPPDIDYQDVLPNSVHVRRKPDSKSIGVDEIREILPIAQSKQTTTTYVVIDDANLVTENGWNAFLKNIEEPKPNVHFVILVRNAATLLATIRSRAQLFYIKDKHKLSDPPAIDAKTLALAKEYISLTPSQLPSFVKKVTKDSKTARQKATELIDATIVLLYKSYHATGNPRFLNKLEQLLTAKERISNGNIKLILVVAML